MTERAFQSTAFAVFGTVILLAVLAVSAGLLSGSLRLGGQSLGALTELELERLARDLFQLAAVGGLVGSGLMIIGTDSATSGLSLRRLPVLRLVERGWIVLVVATLLSGLLGFSDGRDGLERVILIDGLAIIWLGLVLILLTPVAPRSPAILILVIALALHAVAAVLGAVVPATYLADRLLRVLSLGIDRHIALPMGALAVAYYLMSRLSAAQTGWLNDWLDESLYTTGGLVALAGALLTAADLYPLSGSSGLANVGSVASVAVPLLILIVAGHFYRALARRRDNATLSAHWVTLGLLVIMVGNGVLGGLSSPPDVRRWVLGTRFDDARFLLAYLLPLAITLGMINQSSADLHGEDGRITGYIPFWLASAGVLAVIGVLLAITVGQIYMERVVGLRFVEAESLLEPLYRLALGAWLLVALGLGVYAFTFWLRRPPAPEAG